VTTPGVTLTEEPKLAIPERVGSEAMAGGWFVAPVAADQRVDIPKMFSFLVFTVMKAPASEDTCV
jgi:hypothetical protein